MRICITGGPCTGKTTLAVQLDAEYGNFGVPSIYHTDDLMHLDWSEASLAASKWLDLPGPWIIEGVAMSRAIRKWIKAWDRASPPPLDKLIILSDPFEEPTSGQRTMAKGVATVTAEIEPWLREFGVVVERRTPLHDRDGRMITYGPRRTGVGRPLAAGEFVVKREAMVRAFLNGTLLGGEDE